MKNNLRTQIDEYIRLKATKQLSWFTTDSERFNAGMYNHIFVEGHRPDHVYWIRTLNELIDGTYRRNYRQDDVECSMLRILDIIENHIAVLEVFRRR